MRNTGSITMLFSSRLGPGSTSTLSVGGTVVPLNRANKLTVSARGSFNTSGSSMLCTFFASPDNSNYDTIPFGSMWLAVGTPPILRQRTLSMNCDPHFLKAKVQNTAAGTPIINASIVASRQIDY